MLKANISNISAISCYKDEEKKHEKHFQGTTISMNDILTEVTNFKKCQYKEE